MKRQVNRLFLIVMLMFFLVSCDIDSPTSLLFNSPRCSIQSITDIEFPNAGFPKSIITVINNGDGPTAYHVGCIVRLKNGNHILDDGLASFGTLFEGETRSDEIWFSGLKKTDVIEKKTIMLYWYDAEDNYYESGSY